MKPLQLMKTARDGLLALAVLVATAVGADAPAGGEVRLIVRGDDMASSHAANVACIRSYQEGIVRSVELMAPGPWFPEAARLLRDHPGLDVGVHLVLTSEWENMKWRPFTHAPSLVDETGYFFPMVWQNPAFPPNTSLQKSQWKLTEVEAELRAQIETVRRHVPRISHVSAHMGFGGLDPSLGALVGKLAQEYHLEPELQTAGVKPFRGWGRVKSAEQRVQQFVQGLEALQPGTYLFVEHPGLNVPELQAIGHKGYEDVALDRDAVTQVFTSKDVLAAIQKRGIRLMSYRDLKGHE